MSRYHIHFEGDMPDDDLAASRIKAKLADARDQFSESVREFWPHETGAKALTKRPGAGRKKKAA